MPETIRRSPWCEYPAILEHVQPGDIIECGETLIHHYAIYIGPIGSHHFIIHLSGDTEDDAVVKQERIQVLFLNRKCRVNNYFDNQHPPNSPGVIVDRAMSRLNDGGYHILFHNCEHFATWCRNSVEHSEQVENAIRVGASVATGTTLASPALLAASIGSGGSLGLAATLGGPTGGSSPLLLGGSLAASLGESLFSSSRGSLSNPSRSLSNPSATLSNPSATLSNPSRTLSNPFATLSNPSRTLSNPFATLSNPSATLSNPSGSLPSGSFRRS